MGDRSDEPEPRLAVRGVCKHFGPTAALQDVALQARRGEIHAVLGENGAGKSTLMKILAGAITADSGELQLDGRPYAPRDARHARQLGVAIVYQEPLLCPHLSVAENIALGAEPTRWRWLLDRRALRQRARRALAQVLSDDPAEQLNVDEPVGALSPGAQQLVAIARALGQAAAGGGARVLILDEPTSSLTAGDTARLFAAVRRLRQQGLTILYISHFLEEVQQVADRFTVLRDGRAVGGGAISEHELPDIVALMVGRQVDELYPPPGRREPGRVVLQARALAGRRKPRSGDLTLRAGEITGIAGLVGSGRTELLRILFGLDPVTRGEVKVGLYTGPASPALRLRQGVGLLSEDRKGEGLAQRLSVSDNLTLSKLAPLGRWGLISPRRQQELAEQWIARLGIRCHSAGQPVGDLSGGNQQKLAVARLLYHGLDVLLLDEPTRGIDVGSRAEIYGVIEDLAQQGKALLVVSSYLPELFGICDRIAVMRRGELGPARPVGELDPEGVLAEATGA